MTDQPSAREPSQPVTTSATRAKRGRKPGPPRARLSVRISQVLYEHLRALAQDHGANLNDEANQALESWVHGGTHAHTDELPRKDGEVEQ